MKVFHVEHFSQDVVFWTDRDQYPVVEILVFLTERMA